MKLLTFKHPDQRTQVAHLLSTQEIQPLLYADGSPVENLVDLIRKDVALNTLRPDGPPQAFDSVHLLAPIPRPARNIFCVGKNYKNHAEEFTKSGFDAGQTAADAIPSDPIIFSKVPESVIADGQPIWDAAPVSNAVDYEAELAVIIGKGGRGIRKEEALAHVWGYSIINDVTARDWQKRHKQWHLGKSFDSFCPFGPVILTADEVPHPQFQVKSWVNGELRQNASTDDLIFDIPTLIEVLSAGITLVPGDIIATGTPEGVGIGFNPPQFLKAGDVVRVEISGIGRLENRVESH